MIRLDPQRPCWRAAPFALALLWAAASAQPARGQTLTGLAGATAWLDANVPQLMRDAKLPGFSLAIVSEGNTVYAGGFGARDPKRNLPATPDTLYGIGSLTKSFVAVAILQLAEQGKLGLDDPVSRHVPFTLGLPGRPITIRHLLTHSPGFPNLGTSTILISRGLGADTGIPMSSAEDFYRFVNGAAGEVVYPPGEHFFYNNAAWRMLGDIVQRTSGLPFHRYVKERILDPLRMRRSTLDTAVAFADADCLVPHRGGKEGPEPAPFPYPNPEDNPSFSFFSAAGGILSSVYEMTAYLAALMDGGQARGVRILRPESVAQMQSVQIATGEGHYGTEGYGYGLSVAPGFLGHTLVSHGGSVAVSTAYLAYVPERRVGVVMMGNGPGLPYGAVAETVLALMLGHDPASALPANAIRARMTRLVGDYAIYRGLESTKVTLRGGMLYLGSEGAGTPLIPEDPRLGSLRFHTLRDGLRSPVEFLVSDDGSVRLVADRYVYHKR